MRIADLFATLEALAVAKGLMQAGGAPPVKEFPPMKPNTPEQARLPYKDPEEREPGQEG